VGSKYPAADNLKSKETNMPKFKTPTEPVELSPARAKLAGLQRQLADAVAKVTAEADNANRLSVIHDDVEPARSALAAYDADQGAAYARWAKGLATGRPKVVSAIRAELARALADAEQSSAAALIAQGEFQAAAERASAPLAGLNMAIREAVKLVALEEATKLLPAIAEAIATAEGLRHRLDDARAEVMADFEYGANNYPEAGAALAVFDDARFVAQARPAPTADPGSWRRFSAALARDAAVSFEDADAFELPPMPFSASAADTATAAMLAAASFATTSITR
jgi:hypothetical protein